MLASRDLIVNDMEIAVEGAQLDGMVCLSSCDKTPPAHLMAAGRFNIPTILVICGYQPSGDYQGKHVDIEDVFLGVGAGACSASSSKETLRGMCDHAISGPGVCAGMGTANSMHIVCEALGMALPGSAPVLGEQPEDVRDRRAGRDGASWRWCEDDLKPRDILTPGAFRNAAAAVLGVSGSINCIKHLQATAVEAGVDVDVFALFNELGETGARAERRRARTAPDTIDAFEAAGGARALMKQLEPLLDRRRAHGDRPHARATTSPTRVVHDADVIRPLDRPFSDKPPIVVLHGSLAPESAIVKLGLRDPGSTTRFNGPAIVYDDGLEAIAGDPKRRGQARAACSWSAAWDRKGGPGMAGPASRVRVRARRGRA